MLKTVPNIVGAIARLKDAFKFDFSFLSPVKDLFSGMGQALDDFANKGRVSFGAIKQIVGALREIGPAALAAWAMLNPSAAIGALTPLVSALGSLGGMLASVGAGIAGFGSMMAGTFSIAAGFAGALAAKVAGLGGVFANAASIGLNVLGMMTSGIASVASLALASIGPAAILGLVLAGLGLINSQFGAQIDQLLQVVTTKGPMIIGLLVAGITSQIPALIASGTDLVAKFAQAFAVMFPVLVNAGMSLISSLVQGVGANAGSLIIVE